jgi:uncharacterized repeat protein (TIGR01451 family)
MAFGAGSIFGEKNEPTSAPAPTEAEPGDTLTFTITYRNMGNTTIRTATIVDSLLPRLEYVKGSAKGTATPSSRRPKTASARPS